MHIGQYPSFNFKNIAAIQKSLMFLRRFKNKLGNSVKQNGDKRKKQNYDEENYSCFFKRHKIPK